MNKILLLISLTTALAAHSQMIYNQSTGNYENVQVRVNDDRVNVYNYDTNEYSYGRLRDNGYQQKANMYGDNNRQYQLQIRNNNYSTYDN